MTATGDTPYGGVWLSRYEYYSSGRGDTFTGAHHVVLVQHENRLTGQSLPGGSANPDSPLALDLTVDRNVVTGTWTSRLRPAATTRGLATTVPCNSSSSRRGVG